MDLDFSNPLVIGASIVLGLLVLFGVLSLIKTLKKFRTPVMIALIFGLAVGGVVGWELKPPDDCPVLLPQAPIVPPLEETSRPAEENTPDSLQQTEPPAQ